MNQEERDNLLLDLKKGQDILLGRVNNTNHELEKLSLSVARMEEEHGQKLKILFDAIKTHSEKFDSSKNRLEECEKKLQKHSDQIYYLNSKVQAF